MLVFIAKRTILMMTLSPRKKAVPQGVDEIQALIKKQVDDNPIMLYMKGTPSAPSCGFSMQTVRILNATGASYSSVNVLEHDVIREGIKKFSDWPTIPQLYVKGEFVGGCDIVTSMYQNGELETLLKENNLIEADDN
mmetsp:Transcript_37122/g.60783  ORF Transcript_37122/g.60783 Transcript_37122/m.60783 type:complete len:137 (+) Transcript_37122:111-521(+)